MFGDRTYLFESGHRATISTEELLVDFFVTLCANMDRSVEWHPISQVEQNITWTEATDYPETMAALCNFAKAVFRDGNKSYSNRIALPVADESASTRSTVTNRHSTIWNMMKGRSFFITDNGLMGITAANCRVGDMVCSFDGASTRFVVRGQEDDAIDSGYWDGLRVRLVGDAYVRGIGFNVNSTSWEEKDRRRFIIG